MAKGDAKRVQDQLDYQGRLAQDQLNSLYGPMESQYNNYQNAMWGSGAGGNQGGYTSPGMHQGGGDFNSVSDQSMQKFNEMFPGETLTSDMIKAKEAELSALGIKLRPNASGIIGKIELPSGEVVDVIQGAASGVNRRQWLRNDPKFHGGEAGGGQGAAGRAFTDYEGVMNRYKQFADTGGYSDEDLANIRSRAVSPIRSMYASAREGVERNKALSGGYSPNYNAAMAKMTREASQAGADATTNAEAQIAQMKHQGKLAGMGGMAGIYGATPGLANMFGNQSLASMGQRLQGAGLQNDLGRTMIQGQLGRAQVPGNWQQFWGNVAAPGKAIGEYTDALYPWG